MPSSVCISVYLYVYFNLLNYLSIYLGLVVSRIVKGNIPVQNGIVHLIGNSVRDLKG